MKSKPAAGRLHYAWVVAGLTFLTLLVTAGIRSTPGVLIIPLQEEFHWDRATVSLAISINLVLYGLAGPFAAAVMDRFGIRRVIVIALMVAGTAAGLTTFMNAPWQLDLFWGVMIGTAASATASVLAATVANRWFVKRRGLVLGLMTASGATGQLVFLPLLAALVTNVGWRAAAWTTVIAVIIILPIVGLFMRNRPSDIGLRAYGAEPEDPELAPTTGNPFANSIKALLFGLRNRDFWLLAGSFFICGATTNGLIGTHLIPASMDHGIEEVTAASMLALIGVFDIIGTTLSGWLSDRFDSRKLLAWYYGLRGLSLLFLPYALGSGFLSLALFIVFYGLDWVATVPPTVRLAADSFGKARAGVIYGWIFAAHQLGAATASYAGGALYTILGDYQVTFMSAGLLCLIATGLVLRIGRKTKAKPSSHEPEPQPATAPGY